MQSTWLLTFATREGKPRQSLGIYQTWHWKRRAHDV